MHDNIETVKCDELTQDILEENFVRIKKPVKIKGCNLKEQQIPEFFPTDLRKMDSVKDTTTAHMSQGIPCPACTNDSQL